MKLINVILDKFLWSIINHTLLYHHSNLFIIFILLILLHNSLKQYLKIVFETINDLYWKLIELMVIFMKDFINAKIINMEIHQDHFSLNNF